MDINPFLRQGDDAPDLAPPYGDLFAMLGDLWEQAEMARRQFAGNAASLQILDALQAQLAGHAAIVEVVGSVRRQG